MTPSSSVRGAQYKMSAFIFLYFFTWSSSFGLYAQPVPSTLIVIMN